mmetsp:Transcript_6224/g.9054  ORF Transcript_6224/g.9054 Transcript_6224/m.9054 type:complete len:107 (+) Transcript_6224:180-500(+)
MPKNELHKKRLRTPSGIPPPLPSTTSSGYLGLVVGGVASRFVTRVILSPGHPWWAPKEGVVAQGRDAHVPLVHMEHDPVGESMVLDACIWGGTSSTDFHEGRFSSM